jgi:hypothetical protein
LQHLPPLPQHAVVVLQHLPSLPQQDEAGAVVAVVAQEVRVTAAARTKAANNVLIIFLVLVELVLN